MANSKKNITSVLLENLYFIILSFFSFFGYIFIPSYSKQSIAIIFLSLLMIVVFKIKIIKVPKNLKWYVLYMLLSILSIAYSISFQDSLNYILLLIGLFIFQIALNNIKNSNFENISKIICSFAFIHVIATILQLIFPSFIQNINKLILSESGYLYNVSLYKYGCFAGICSDHGANAIFISIFLVFLSANLMKEKKIKTIFLFLIGLIALLLTGKRGYLLAVIAAFVVTFITFKNNKKNNVIKKVIFLSILIFVIILILKYIPATSFVIDRFFDLSRDGNLLNGREDMYKILINNIKENWVLGTGVNSTMVINLGNNGHNAFLQVFSELGIIGIFSFVGLIISNLIYAFKHKNTNNIYSIFYQIFFICIAFTGNPMHYIPTMIMYFFMISKIYLGGKENENSNINIS